jgi:acyl-CoA thioester hydrolase
MARRRRTPLPFEILDDAPAPLEADCSRRVRFQEVDPLGIVWHGHYASFYEDARVAFGDRYHLTYTQMHDVGFTAPIVQMTTDFLMPLHFDQSFRVKARAHWSDLIRLHFEYLITDTDDQPIAHGATVQALLDLEGAPLITWPEFMLDFREKWQRESLTS